MDRKTYAKIRAHPLRSVLRDAIGNPTRRELAAAIDAALPDATDAERGQLAAIAAGVATAGAGGRTYDAAGLADAKLAEFLTGRERSPRLVAEGDPDAEASDPGEVAGAILGSTAPPVDDGALAAAKLAADIYKDW